MGGNKMQRQETDMKMNSTRVPHPCLCLLNIAWLKPQRAI
jgi:hypothetical protein